MTLSGNRRFEEMGLIASENSPSTQEVRNDGKLMRFGEELG